MFRGIYFNQTFSFFRYIDCCQLLTLFIFTICYIFKQELYITSYDILKSFIVPPALLTIFTETSAIVYISAIIAEISTSEDIHLIANTSVSSALITVVTTVTAVIAAVMYHARYIPVVIIEDTAVITDYL